MVIDSRYSCLLLYDNFPSNLKFVIFYYYHCSFYYKFSSVAYITYLYLETLEKLLRRFSISFSMFPIFNCRTVLSFLKYLCTFIKISYYKALMSTFGFLRVTNWATATSSFGISSNTVKHPKVSRFLSD